VENADLCSDQAVEAAFESSQNKVDIVYHIAALVGPFHVREKYFDVSVKGTERIIANCQKYKVPKLSRLIQPIAWDALYGSRR
jgi:nucleoside-diphosphate-sugar epimerase